MFKVFATLTIVSALVAGYNADKVVPLAQAGVGAIVANYQARHDPQVEAVACIKAGGSLLSCAGSVRRWVARDGVDSVSSSIVNLSPVSMSDDARAYLTMTISLALQTL